MKFSNESWHLSKNVPIAILVMFAIQTSSFVWYMAKLDSQVEANTRADQEQTDAIRQHIEADFLKSDGRAQEAILTARIAANTRDVGKIERTLLRMEGKIDQIIQSHSTINGVPQGNNFHFGGEQ